LTLTTLALGVGSYKLRNLKVVVADEESAGMNGPNFFKKGGQVRLVIKSSETVRPVSNFMKLFSVGNLDIVIFPSTSNCSHRFL